MRNVKWIKNDTDERMVKCTWCDEVYNESELSYREDDERTEKCPRCNHTGCIMDVGLANVV